MRNRIYPMTLTALAAMLAIGCSGGEKPAAEPAAPAEAEAAAPGPAVAPDVAPEAIPDTEIFTATLSMDGGAPSIGALRNATDHEGYDNQPSFLPGEAAFYFVREGETGKTDIWLHDLSRQANVPVFSSPAVSEYSPKRAPDGLHVSYIQENEAGDVTRVHWRLIDGSDEGAAVADFAPLGYYAWIEDGAGLVVYYRSEPGSLHRVDVASGATMKLHDTIGRALVADKAGAHVWFTEAPPVDPNAAEDAPPSGPFKIMRYDVASGAIEPVVDLPGAAQDFAVIFDETGAPAGIFSVDGGTLYFRGAAADILWAPVGDLAGIANPTRIAVSDDRKWIAIVGEKPAD